MSVRIRATFQLRDLGRTQRKGLSPHIGLFCNTVPDILNELQALVDGEMTVVEGWLRHKWNMRCGDAPQKQTNPPRARCGMEVMMGWSPNRAWVNSSRVETELPAPPATVLPSHHTETNPCHPSL
ncbi:hypothetical protein BH09GEM1_BH09GEM1_10500 [soil metagenome]